MNQLIRGATKAWHGTKLNQPDWSPQSRSLALCAIVRAENLSFHLILNAYWEPLEFEVPVDTNPWRRWIDTSLQSPHDIVDWSSAPIVTGRTYRAGPRSVVVLIASDEDNQET